MAIHLCNAHRLRPRLNQRSRNRRAGYCAQSCWLRTHLSREGFRRALGSAGTPPSPRSTPQGRRSCGLETWPALPFASRCRDDNGTAGWGQSRISQLDRSDRHNHTGRPHEPARRGE